MEDPKRMRTKLRLDLADVRKQIEELEEHLKEEKTEENIEAHRKLVEYEKKLKDQYERMTGMSIEEANKLKNKNQIAQPTKESPIAGSIGLISGLILAWGFYNTVLHSVAGFGPTALLDYFMGTGGSASNLEGFGSSMFYGISFYLILVPILTGAGLLFVSNLLDNSRNTIFSIVEGIGWFSFSGYFAFMLFNANSPSQFAQNFVNNLLFYAITVIVAGVLIIIAGIEQEKLITKIFGVLAGILVLYSGVQLFLIDFNGLDVNTVPVYQWPWITIPIVLAAVFQSIAYLTQLIDNFEK